MLQRAGALLPGSAALLRASYIRAHVLVYARGDLVESFAGARLGLMRAAARLRVNVQSGFAVFFLLFFSRKVVWLMNEAGCFN